MRFLPIFASSLAVVAASPFPEPTGEVEKRTTGCSTKDNLAYKVLSAQGAKGSIFCNDYLHLPTVTKHTTLPEKTTTVYVKKTKYTGEECEHYKRKAEDDGTLAKRQGLALFAADVISKGCECLNLHPRTVTKTYTPPAHVVTKYKGETTTCGSEPTPH